MHISPKLRALKPETEGKVVGKDAIRAWWKDSLERYQSQSQKLTLDFQLLDMKKTPTLQIAIAYSSNILEKFLEKPT